MLQPGVHRFEVERDNDTEQGPQDGTHDADDTALDDKNTGDGLSFGAQCPQDRNITAFVGDHHD